MPDDDFGARRDSEEDPAFDGPTLDVDGNLSKRFEPAPPPKPRDEPIELAERTATHIDPTPDSYRPEIKPKRRLGPRLAVISAALAVALFAAALSLPSRMPGVWRSLGALGSIGTRHSVVVTSEPAGATVKIAGTVVGLTPWAGDNLWGDTEVTVELPGYKRWTGRLEHDTDANFNAVLRR